MSIKQSDLEMVLYFIEEKGDIERWSSWDEKKDEILEEFPILLSALQLEKQANQVKDAALLVIRDKMYRWAE